MRRPTGLIAAIVIGAVVLQLGAWGVAAVVVGEWFGQADDHASLAEANDCLAGTSTDPESLRIVNCADIAATLQVTERLENQTYSPVVAESNCTDPDVTSTMYYSYPLDNTTYLLLCLKPYFGPPQ